MQLYYGEGRTSCLVSDYIYRCIDEREYVGERERKEAMCTFE